MTAPATRSRAPTPIRPRASAAAGDEGGCAGEGWAAALGVADGDGVVAPTTSDGVGEGAAAGSITVTSVGAWPWVESDATSRHWAGEYVGATWYPSGAEISSTQYVAGFRAPATATPLPSVAIVAI